MTDKILILNLTRMGDLIQSTPLISGLRKKYPQAHISLAVTSDFSGFAERIPHVDEVIEFNLRQFNENNIGMSWVKIYHYLKEFLNNLAVRKFDLVFNLSHSKLSAFMIAYLGIKNIRGFRCNGEGDRMTEHPWLQYFFTEPFNRQFNSFNLVDIFTRSGDIDPGGRAVQIKTNPDDWNSAKGLVPNVAENDFVVAIQAGSSIEGRRWPASSFASLADQLVKNLDAKIILLGVKSESKMAEEIISLMKFNDRVTDLTGKTSISQLTGVLSRCNYLVTNDTGTMHIAAALGVHIAALFFAHAHPYETSPYAPGHVIFQARIPCAPCSYGVTCNDVVCINKVRPALVYSMMKIHKESGCWKLPDDSGTLDEVNIFETSFDSENLMRLKPLVKHPATTNDIFRTAYRRLWMDCLGSYHDGQSMTLERTVSIIRDDYDLNGFNTDAIWHGVEIFKELAQLGDEGIKTSETIYKDFQRNKNGDAAIHSAGEKVTALDERINLLGMTNPTTKPVTDMFNKRKENFEGSDISLLAMETIACYRKLKEESQEMARILTYIPEALGRDFSFPGEESGSISAALPGR